MLSNQSNYSMEQAKNEISYYPGDLVCWGSRSSGKEKIVYGVITYRYCEEARMESYYKRHKSKVDIDEQLKQFYVNEIMEVGTGTMHTVDDRYLLLISRGKVALG